MSVSCDPSLHLPNLFAMAACLGQEGEEDCELLMHAAYMEYMLDVRWMAAFVCPAPCVLHRAHHVPNAAFLTLCRRLLVFWKQEKFRLGTVWCAV